MSERERESSLFGLDRKEMLHYLDKLMDMAKGLTNNPAGLSVVSMLIGMFLKYMPKQYELVGAVRIKETGAPVTDNPNAYCTWLKKNYPETFSVTCVLKEPSIDVFPINSVFGFDIDPSLGKVPVSDVFMIAGFLGMAGSSVELLGKLRDLISKKF